MVVKIKKILLGLLLISFSVLIIAPTMVVAADIPAEVTGCTMRHSLTAQDWIDRGFDCAPKNDPCPFNSTTYTTCGICCIMDTVYTVTDWIFVGVIILSSIFVFVGAFSIMTAAGDPEKVGSGRKYITGAMIGLMIALLAKALPAIVKGIFGA